MSEPHQGLLSKLHVYVFMWLGSDLCQSLFNGCTCHWLEGNALVDGMCFPLCRTMQAVKIDKHVKLLDSPGIVMATSMSDASTILRNCVKVSLSAVMSDGPL